VVVDHQRHWYPPRYLEALLGRRDFPRTRRTGDGWTYEVSELAPAPVAREQTDLEHVLAVAAEHGVDAVVTGPATLGEVLHLPAAEAAELFGVLHEELAAAQRDRPDRVRCLAALPLQDADVALDVLERAVVELGLVGVSVLASNDGPAVATERTLPVFRRIEELGVPVVLHPGLRTSTASPDASWREEAALAWMYHTARAALGFVDSGTLDACPRPDRPPPAPRQRPAVRLRPHRRPLGQQGEAPDRALPPQPLLHRRRRRDAAGARARHRRLRQRPAALANLDPALVERIFVNRLPGLRYPGD